MSKQATYDEKDMPRIADAYDELFEKVFEQDIVIADALLEVTMKYELTEGESDRLMSWLSDAIMDMDDDCVAHPNRVRPV